MHPTEIGLTHLIGPVGEEVFFRDYWEKQPLLINRGRPDYYAGLLSAADVDHVLAFTRPKFVEPGGFPPKERQRKNFVQGWLADQHSPDGASFPGIAEVRQVFEQGKTVVVMAMQHRWPPAAALCRNLEAVFHCPVHANMYLTPKGAQGFDAHFDPHEVFVLQLEGSKQWRLYGPARSLPLAEERFTGSRDQLGEPREVRLGPGDMLYIPRGHVHEAFTAACGSLHLTVGVNVYRWADLLHHAVAAAARRDERFRGSVPPGALGGPDVPPAVGERFRELLEVLARGADVAAAVRSLGDQFFGQVPALPGGHFLPPGGDEAIDLDTVVEKAPGVVCRVVRDGGWVAIEFPGGKVGGPLKIASALRFVAAAAAGAFPVRALSEDLGAEAKLVLARRLVRERLLTVVSRPITASAGD